MEQVTPIRPQIRSIKKRKKIAAALESEANETAQWVDYAYGMMQLTGAQRRSDWKAAMRESIAGMVPPDQPPAPVQEEAAPPLESPPAIEPQQPEKPRSRFSARIRQALVDARKIGPDATDRTIEGVVVHCFGNRALEMDELELWVHCDLEREHIEAHLARFRR